MKLREWLAINKVDVPKEKERSQGSPPYLNYNHGWNNSLSEILSLEVPERMVELDVFKIVYAIWHENNLEGYEEMISATKHSGDCTKECHTCLVCQRERFRKDTKAICSHFSQPRQALCTVCNHNPCLSICSKQEFRQPRQSDSEPDCYCYSRIPKDVPCPRHGDRLGQAEVSKSELRKVVIDNSSAKGLDIPKNYKVMVNAVELVDAIHDHINGKKTRGG